MNQRSILFLFLVATVALLLFGCAGSQTPAVKPVPSTPEPVAPVENIPAVTETPDPTPAPVETPPAEPTVLTVSSTELALHNKAVDCWIGYKGEVYDVTSYLPKHPGGVGAISMNCGTSSQFEQAFTNQHGTSKVSLLKKQGLFKGALE